MSQDDLFSSDLPPAPAPAPVRAAAPAAPAPDPADAASLAATATTLAQLRAVAAGCRACDLWEHATQTVFGEGPDESRGSVELVFVGEQPGDREDLEGRPFVGPAGALFNRALADAGIARETTYVTNAVKHFKWKPQDTRGTGFRGTGKRRIHQTPTTEEVTACRPWLQAEIALLAPQLVMLLGATAAKTVLGASFRVTRDRGRLFVTPRGLRCMATVHPSAILRTDDAQRPAAYEGLVADLRAAAKVLSGA